MESDVICSKIKSLSGQHEISYIKACELRHNNRTNSTSIEFRGSLYVTGCYIYDGVYYSSYDAVLLEKNIFRTKGLVI